MRSKGNMLKQCCYRSLRENRKRTAVTIVGIVMAAALITAVACMVVSFRASMIAYERLQNGDFHYCFQEVPQEYLKYFPNNQYIRKYGLTEEIGYAVLEGSQNPDKPYLYLSAIDETAEGALALLLTEGRMPENASELVIGRHIRSNGMVDLEVGDTVKLSVGDRVSEGRRMPQETPYLEGEEALENVREQTYTVVGIVERPNTEVEPRIAPGYSAFTCLEEPEKAKVLNVYATYTRRGLKQADQVTAGILGVPVELYQNYYNGRLELCTEEEILQIQKAAKRVFENYWLLKWELLTFSSTTMNLLYGMSAVAILIIIVTSVFCIHNSFTISLTEKTKLYGRLASVGTTSGQRRKIVYYEACFLGIAGIPLGVLSGISAAAILVKAVGGLVEDALGFPLVFALSWSMILLAVALSAVTIFFSASRSAKRAGKISPISAIRANDMVKIQRKEMRCPGFIGKLFGIGGKIAYRNLKRARVKYRTTIISIVISVAVFIGMSTFVELMERASDIYYENMTYQLRVSIYDWKFYDQALAVTKIDGVQEAEIVRSAYFQAQPGDIAYREEYRKAFDEKEETEDETIVVWSLGEEAYKRYCDRIGVSVEEAEDRAIVIAEYYWETLDEDGTRYVEEGKIAEFRKGDIIRGSGQMEDVAIEVLAQTEEEILYQGNRSINNIVLIVSDQWMDAHPQLDRYDNIEICIKCDDAYKVEESVRDMKLQHFTLTNYETQYRADRSMHLVVAIFLYGFITVVALIGITNIFNTITTNLDLRAPEFAMLKSVGMTGREFRRMIWLEGVFYGGGALLIGIPLGILLSVCFNRIFGRGIVMEKLHLPWMGTGVSIVAVILLLYVIMHYSMRKINRKNIIETIQNENI
ncbi:ABC transporter permease [Acetatifactor muris]|uniref:ABC transporter permease n=1 Tax=Acetatifactor muris TaxID=879566 RepID=UPI0023F0E51F|nr:ABC transporter permease [Acetatifactor muris]